MSIYRGESDGPLLLVTDVCKSYGGVHAAQGVCLSVERGQVAAVIGPNGAGKSTVFDIIAGSTAADSGSIKFAGAEVAGRRPEHMARVGLARTFQNVRVLPGLSVRENVLIGMTQFARTSLLACLLRLPAFRREDREFNQRAMDLLSLIGLADRAEVLASSLPYGRRKVLELAMALATEPSLLLLDEPAAGLNQTEKAELAALIKSVNRAGVAVLLIEHDVTFVTDLADTLTVLNFGEVVASGDPGEVLNDPNVIRIYLGEHA